MSITYQVARERQAELLQSAERRGRARIVTAGPARVVASDTPIVALRLARADEATTVRRLAALDSAAAPVGPVLLAIMDGEPVAALALDDGRVLADPFVDSRDAVALLRLRADHLRGYEPKASRRWRRFGRRRPGQAGVAVTTTLSR